MRAVVFGNRELGCVCLEELLAQKVEVPLVVTYPRDPAEAPGYRCLAEVAAARGLPVATPPDAAGEDLFAKVRAVAPDAIFSFYYGHRIGKALRDVPPLGAFNLHGSLLPRWRGRAPLPFVILSGEREAGVTLHFMVREMDAGDVVGQASFPVAPRETSTTLYAKTSAAARALLRRAVPLVASGRAPRASQDPGRATFTPPLLPEREVDRACTVERFDRVVRAFARPYPGARTPLGSRRAILWAGEPGTRRGGIVLPLADGPYTVLRLAVEGGPETVAGEFLRLHPAAEAELGKPSSPG